MRFIFSLIICLNASLHSIGQNLLHEKGIESLNQLRTHILRHNSIELEQLLDKIGEENLENEVFFNSIIEEVLKIKLRNVSSIKASESFNTHSKILNLGISLSNEEIELLVSNFELIELLSIGLLKAESPFDLDFNSSFFEELKFYSIKDNQRIGEIGGGNGTFTVLSGIINPKVDLVINELGDLKVEFLDSRINNYYDQISRKKIQVVKGDKNKTNFEKGAFDKLIIRNTFHHFKKKKKMLASLKKSLKPDGELILYEPFIEFQESERTCMKIMELDKAIKVIEKEDFVLVERKQVGSRLLLKFKIKK